MQTFFKGDRFVEAKRPVSRSGALVFDRKMVPRGRSKRSENRFQIEVESDHKIDKDFDPISGRFWIIFGPEMVAKQASKCAKMRCVLI